MGMFEDKSLKPDRTTGHKLYFEAFSPFLRFGCLSTRRLFDTIFNWEVESIEMKSTISHLANMLLIREYAIFVGCFVRNIDIDKCNVLCTLMEWKNDKDKLKAFTDGETGYPWIDAIVRSI